MTKRQEVVVDTEHGKEPAAGVRKPARVAGERGGIQSLERASAILDSVARQSGGMGLGDISSETGLHTSTAHHLVKTLVSLGFIDQDTDSKRYRIGGRLFALAAGALNETVLLSLATPVLERLSERTGEAAHLAVRSGRDVVVIARTAATGLLQMSDRTGSTRPAHATAIGKVLLSELPGEDLERVLEGLTLTRYTPDTITGVRALRRELEAVRQAGVAYDNGELDVDVRCMALPVRDFAGRCVGAIGISGPVWRMSEQLKGEKLAVLRETAGELSAQLGFQGGKSRI